LIRRGPRAQSFGTGHRTAKSQGPRVKLGWAYIGSAARVQQWQAWPRARKSSALQRLHSDNAGNGFDRAGDLRRDFEPARQLDLDLAAVSQQEHHADLAVGGLGAIAVAVYGLLRSFKPARHAGERFGIAEENPQAAVHPRRRLVERLDRLNAGADLVTLHLGGEKQQHGAARLQEIAILR